MGYFVDGFFDFSLLGNFEGIFMHGFKEYKIEIEIFVNGRTTPEHIQLLRVYNSNPNFDKESIHNVVLPFLLPSTTFCYNIEDDSYMYFPWDNNLNQRSLVASIKGINKIRVLSIVAVN